MADAWIDGQMYVPQLKSDNVAVPTLSATV